MTTLDERIEAARNLDGYTPGPWTFETESGDWPDHSLIGGNGDPVLWWDFDLGFRHSTTDAAIIAAAPDLHRLALDLAADRERLREALAFYAAETNWRTDDDAWERVEAGDDDPETLDGIIAAVEADSGDTARAALASEPRE